MTADERAPAALPAGLRDRVLAASRQARRPGRPVPEAIAISPAEAFSRSADAFNGLLCALREEDWRTAVLRGLDVQRLVGHLIGVEYDMHRCLVGDPDVADADHIDSTQPAADRQAGLPPAVTRAEWRRAADRTVELANAAGGRGTDFALHGMRLPLGALLVARAFELWTHENDIRRATGLPACAPDPSTLRQMTELAARLLPHGAARTGLREPAIVHLVLTGPGGGTWDISVGDGQVAQVAIQIVTDAVGFCRLVANRIRPDELDLHVTGDRARAARVLNAARALALD